MEKRQRSAALQDAVAPIPCPLQTERRRRVGQSFAALSRNVASTTLGPVNTFGLTGGIGMGKSTAADLLRRRGFPVVDSDVIAREIVEPGQPALAEIRQLFGREILGDDGRLRRDELAKRVFADASEIGRAHV